MTFKEAEEALGKLAKGKTYALSYKRFHNLDEVQVTCSAYVEGVAWVDGHTFEAVVMKLRDAMNAVQEDAEVDSISA